MTKNQPIADKPPKTSNGDIGRFKSPPYPFIALPKAMERVKALHAKAQHHPVGTPVLADAWKYSVKSSGLIQTVAALMQFGLLADEGSGDKRRFRLTHDALRIVQDADPLSEKRKAALIKAALYPKVHKELWEKYGATASDIVLKNYLTLDRREAGQAPFSGAAADILINEYKTSIAYAELEKNAGFASENDGMIQDENGSEEAGFEGNEPSKSSNPGNKPPFKANPESKIMQGERELTKGLLSKDANFRLIVSGKIGVKEIERLIQKLEVDKEILAEPDEDDLSDIV